MHIIKYFIKVKTNVNDVKTYRSVCTFIQIPWSLFVHVLKLLPISQKDFVNWGVPLVETYNISSFFANVWTISIPLTERVPTPLF